MPPKIKSEALLLLGWHPLTQHLAVPKFRCRTDLPATGWYDVGNELHATDV